MLDNKAFEQILDKNDQVLKIYLPDKKRAWCGTILYAVFMALILVPVTVCCFFASLISGIFMALFCLLFVVMPLIGVKLWCDKTIYAVTDKRILIRTGYIGVDYKSLDFKMLGAISVNVGLVDKMIRRNTGSISFGSMSSPLTAQNPASYSFRYVVAPYDVNREVKEIIDAAHTN